MLDKALSHIQNTAQNAAETYYFQLVPLTLSIIGKDSQVPAPGTTYKFCILKAQQKFDENKLPIQSNFKKVSDVELMPIPKCQLNFYLPNFTKGRKSEFNFKMFQYESQQEFEIGDYLINPEPYINQFKDQKIVRFQEKAFFSEDYQLQFQLYIERSRFALQKVVKEFKAQRVAKSPARERKEESVTSSIKKEQKKNPSGLKTSRSEDAPSQDRPQQKFQEGKISRKSPQQSLRQSKQSKATTLNAEQKIEEPPADNQSQSFAASSPRKIPILQTRFHQLAKNDAPSEIRMSESQRMGRVMVEVQLHQKETEAEKKSKERKQKIFLVVFVMISMFVMYWAMHPIKKA